MIWWWIGFGWVFGGAVVGLWLGAVIRRADEDRLAGWDPWTDPALLAVERAQQR